MDNKDYITRIYAGRLWNLKVSVPMEMNAFSLTILIKDGIPDNDRGPNRILHPAVMKRDRVIFAINRIEIKTITIEEEDIAANKERCHLRLRDLARRCLFLGNIILDKVSLEPPFCAIKIVYKMT